MLVPYVPQSCLVRGASLIPSSMDVDLPRGISCPAHTHVSHTSHVRRAPPPLTPEPCHLGLCTAFKDERPRVRDRECVMRVRQYILTDHDVKADTPKSLLSALRETPLSVSQERALSHRLRSRPRRPLRRRPRRTSVLSCLVLSCLVCLAVRTQLRQGARIQCVRLGHRTQLS